MKNNVHIIHLITSNVELAGLGSGLAGNQPRSARKSVRCE